MTRDKLMKIFHDIYSDDDVHVEIHSRGELNNRGDWTYGIK
jgi:hypothetical protein